MRCVYSISRRLGRPAKKRDDMQDNSKDREVSEHPRGEIIRRDRSPRKRTAKPDLGQTSGHDIKHSQEHDEGILEEVAFNDSIVNDMSTEDTRLPAPPFLDADKLSLYEGSDTIDLSDNWLQEFISGQPADLAQDCDFLDALGLNSADGALMAVPPGTRGLTCSTNAIDVASSELQDQMPPTAYYLPASGFSAYSEPANGSAQVKAEIALPYPGPLKREWLAWPQTVPFLTEHDAARFPAMDEHLNPLITTKGKCHPPEYGPSSEGPTLSTATAARQYQCQCHDHLARDLMLLTISASRVGPSVTIDSILKCQQILQQLTDTILECPICCKTRVNLLMIVVVSIDSLITALETITSVEGGVWDGFWSVAVGKIEYDERDESTGADGDDENENTGEELNKRSTIRGQHLIMVIFCFL
ncbi:hypothetical protein BDV26DRAFT_285641 [Aspergillus bertholletiae]|uniref:Uncharacterized protein n=1 Tax=Aspergillus bertholletiae TaxID=1226010 RepID=A0A5N7AV96_9EURO|nr:hypothetical protein BDV26DRAFT_285641 [Aspergillus bertholletiae]